MNGLEIKFLLSMNDSQFVEFIRNITNSQESFTSQTLYDTTIFRFLWGEPMTLTLRQSIFSAFHTIEKDSFKDQMPLLLNTVITRCLLCDVDDISVQNTIPEDTYIASRLALSNQQPNNVEEIISFLLSEFVSNMFRLEFSKALQCMSGLISWSNKDEIKRQVMAAYKHINAYKYCFELDLPEKEISIYEHCYAQSL